MVAATARELALVVIFSITYVLTQACSPLLRGDAALRAAGAQLPPAAHAPQAPPAHAQPPPPPPPPPQPVRTLPPPLPLAAAAACPGHANIRARYEAELRKTGNVEKHMPILFALASGFENITELGVHSVHSSWALARAAADGAARGERVTYRALDIARDNRVGELEGVMRGCPGVAFSFTEADDLLVEPWGSNFLFLDTWHTYKQLVRELAVWPPHVSHYIALHDTVLFAARDEDEGQASRRKEELFAGLPAKVGLDTALTEFLKTEEGKRWRIWEKYANQNGVTVLERITPL
jgi:hypothetical protein